ncbi:MULTISPECIES: DegT/DnrJ/EryC1/StrS family aminotransferase [Helicobacter]|uniref:DegT/DnrJ/EryC1/StrS family aminotransferase n=1 Tax=Helicobacter ibis TaxID=2962633 RepID=A0ABT4VCK6_9HELI|nr:MULTISPECIES: DegT/DnrJ/EryC1/StrS family aminotransferase [Helicobacter]MDA3967584.1 DegT/DnrJ/EryC1/StrS family aminotransferase [Helicobacter sp. WB40]MDA3968337.1 DegT/DnrJ/EryC1/StrS family aminotransferase [Helicobacter ibis]
MAIKFLDLHKQYLSIKDEIDGAICEVIESSSFVGGESVREFEREFAEYIGGGMHCLGVANGTDALEIAIEALNLPNDSEVLVPANTFAASAEAVVRNNLKVVFVDCASDYTIDIDDLRSKINKNTSAIVAVHLYGQSARINEILELAKSNNLKVIEDCAQAHGATFNGKRVGSFGDIATFSFYPGKNLGAYGDGGAIVSKDFALLEKCKAISTHGGLKKYEHIIAGRNSRLDSMQAAILRVKLRHLDKWIQRRNEVSKMYLEGLSGCVILPEVKESCMSVWHLFVIRIKNREALIKHLESKGIEIGLHYPNALPNTPAFSNKEYVIDSKTTNANMWQDEILSIPMGEHLIDEEVQFVIEAIKEFV